ncbi:MAG: hypothetical protein ACYS8I_12760 [Planctomycetota bacterium]|jgi:hypothetical protein
MAKNTGDVILRDRLQFTIPSSGNVATQYGRLDLQDYVSAVERKALAIKEIYIQFRTPNSLVQDQTGEPVLLLREAVGDGATNACLKVFATTRAYELAAQVGIGSPDVCHMETWRTSTQGIATASGQSNFALYDHSRFGPMDLHPEGFPVISDLLIGVAGDELDAFDDEVVELDILVIAEPITVTQKTLTQMLTQQTDL